MGQTIFIHKLYHKILETTQYYHFIIDENNTAYWVSFSESECNSTSTLQRKPCSGASGNSRFCVLISYSQCFVQPTISFFTVKVNDNIITFNDNAYEFEIKITENEAVLTVTPIVVR